jgi:hypothetical protein
MTAMPQSRWQVLDMLLLLLGPLLHGLFLGVYWAWGAGWFGLAGLLVSWLAVRAVELLGVAGVVVLLIWQRRTTVPPSPQRNFAASFLIFIVALSLLLPWGGVAGWMRTQGRHHMEASLPLSALAEECRQLTKEYADDVAAPDRVKEVPPPYPPTIARLGNVGVFVGMGSLFIEQAGGFDHYGYRFTLDPETQEGVLSWRTEGGGEQLLPPLVP